MNRTKTKDLIFGLAHEESVADKISKIFNLKLYHTKFKYSLFDYYDDKNEFIFEIKNYTYPFNKYKTEIIGVNKGISNNGVFIFKHEGDNNIYYTQFNSDLFKTFNKRYIKADYRSISVLCYDIPKSFIKIINNENNEIHKIISYTNELNNIKNLIEEDEQKYIEDKELYSLL